MDHECPVNVVGYDKSCGTQHRDLPTVSGALAYNDPNSGAAIMLIVHQAISVTTMSNNLLCPMQIRMNDVELNDTPKFLTENPMNKTQAISGRDQDGREHTIPFTLCGVTSYIPICKPSIEQFETCPRIELTCKSPEWDPHSETFKHQEEALLDKKGLVQDAPMPVERGQRRRFISTLDTSENTTLFPKENDPVHGLGAVLADNVNVLSIHTDRWPKLNAVDLAQRWGIGIEKARQTIARTTQRGLQSVLHPTLMQWYRTNDCQFQY